VIQRSGERLRGIEFSLAVERGIRGCGGQKLNGLTRNAVVCVRFERDLEGGGRGIACEPPLPVDQYQPSRVKEA